MGGVRCKKMNYVNADKDLKENVEYDSFELSPKKIQGFSITPLATPVTPLASSQTTHMGKDRKSSKYNKTRNFKSKTHRTKLEFLSFPY